MLEKEYAYYQAHKDEFLKIYLGKFIVIVNEEIIGTFATVDEAYKEAAKTHQPGTFLIQQVTIDENHIQRFTSLVYV